jgi:hypothetical protein
MLRAFEAVYSKYVHKCILVIFGCGGSSCRMGKSTVFYEPEGFIEGTRVHTGII